MLKTTTDPRSKRDQAWLSTNTTLKINESMPDRLQSHQFTCTRHRPVLTDLYSTADPRNKRDQAWLSTKTTALSKEVMETSSINNLLLSLLRDRPRRFEFFFFKSRTLNDELVMHVVWFVFFFPPHIYTISAWVQASTLNGNHPPPPHSSPYCNCTPDRTEHTQTLIQSRHPHGLLSRG